MFGRKLKKWLLFLIIAILIGACSINAKLSFDSVKNLSDLAHYSNGQFQNVPKIHNKSFGRTMARIIKRSIFEKDIDNKPTKPLALKTLTKSQLNALSDNELFLVRLGHSSILMKVYGKYWLLDPMFSKYASPFQFAGPKRFHAPPISIKELPYIDKVLISHNHYDHLDENTIKQLMGKTNEFLVPLGNKKGLLNWGVEQSKVKELNWWQEYQSKDALFVFTPSQHFSGRSLSDRNHSLWGSWVIKTPTDSLFFSGDSGYFNGFKKIGDKYGPFDFTMIETGAYNREWPNVHMFPEESVKAHMDLRGKIMMPIHNGTFDLAFHPWYEPLERVTVEARKQKVNLTTPIVGEVFSITQEAKINPWWLKSK